jgi:hypothetical protein
MKTYLEICNDVRFEAGLSGVPLTGISSAKGIDKRITGWVRQAWLDIQEYRNDWPWMTQTVGFVTSPGKQTYSPAELLFSDLGEWVLDGALSFKTATGLSAGYWLDPHTYSAWWTKDRIGIQQSGAPAKIFVSPTDFSLMLHPVPDAEYTISLRYRRTPQVLTNPLDVPQFPVNNEYREMIKWKALIYYAWHDGSPDTAIAGEVSYANMLSKLDNRYGSQINITARPIA